MFASAGDSVIRYVRGKEIGRFVTRSLGFSRSGSASSSGSRSDAESSDADSSDEETDDSSSDSSDDDENTDSSNRGGELNNLLLFGNTLMALSSSGRRMYVWDVPPYVKPASKDLEEAEAADEEVTPYATLEMPQGFTATKLVHPASYLNKVVVGSKEGELAVWNIRTG